MKKLILILPLIILSCQTEERTEPSKPVELGEDRVTTFTYEGCEYIRIGFGSSRWGSHKGNCSNPDHKK
jgi:hypothetical protein